MHSTGFSSRFWLHPCDTPVCLHCEGISETAAYFVGERISELHNLRKAIFTPNRYSILVCRESGELRQKHNSDSEACVAQNIHLGVSLYVLSSCSLRGYVQV